MNLNKIKTIYNNKIALREIDFQRDDHFIQQNILTQKHSDLNDNCSLQRKLEFLCGRYLAADLLKSKYNCSEPLARAGSGIPLWPTGYTGSISHTKNKVIVAVAAQEDFTSIGVDLERLDRLPTLIRIESKILTPFEREQFNQYHQFKNCLIFSLKESFYKFIYPMVKRYIGFLEVECFEINVIDNSFGLILKNDLSKDLLQGMKFQGHFLKDDTSVLTLIGAKF